MFRFKLIILAFVIASAVCDDVQDEAAHGGDQGGDKGHFKHRAKMMKCLKETNDLHPCCPYPTSSFITKESECKLLLKGLSEKTEREQHKAHRCFLECLFTEKGILKDEHLDKEKIIEVMENIFQETDLGDFQSIARESINFCTDKLAIIEEKNLLSGSRRPVADPTNEGKKKCNFLPAAYSACFIGKVVRNCPESQWQKTDECEAIKANVTSIEDCMTY